VELPPDGAAMELPPDGAAMELPPDGAAPTPALWGVVFVASESPRFMRAV